MPTLRRAATAVECGDACRGIGDERPVGDGRAWMRLVVLNHPMRAVDDGLDGSAKLFALHHLHVDDLGFGRDAERRAGDCSGDGGAMRVADFGIVGEAREAGANATGELRMLRRHAAIEHVDGDAVAGARVAIGAIERRTTLVDPVERERSGERLVHHGPSAGRRETIETRRLLHERNSRNGRDQARPRHARTSDERSHNGDDGGAGTDRSRDAVTH